MTQTVGFWCDECRTKYVQHTCHDGLPCGHDMGNAIRVYAKAYGKGGETITMDGQGIHINVWIFTKPREPGVTYIGRPRREVETEDGRVDLWEWLAKYPAPIIRAFWERWSSSKYPPTWRLVELHATVCRGDRGGSDG